MGGRTSTGPAISPRLPFWPRPKLVEIRGRLGTAPCSAPGSHKLFPGLGPPKVGGDPIQPEGTKDGEQVPGH